MNIPIIFKSPVEGATLVQAFLKAANDTGWKVESEEKKSAFFPGSAKWVSRQLRFRAGLPLSSLVPGPISETLVLEGMVDKDQPYRQWELFASPGTRLSDMGKTQRKKSMMFITYGAIAWVAGTLSLILLIDGFSWIKLVSGLILFIGGITSFISGLKKESSLSNVVEINEESNKFPEIQRLVEKLYQQLDLG